MDEYAYDSQQAAVSYRRPSAQQADLFSALELFPIPIEVFSMDGVSVFVNRAFLTFFRIPDAAAIVGKLNILKDPFINYELGLTDYLRRVFSGELLSFYDIRVPVEEIASRYMHKQGGPMEEDMYQDITSFPLQHEDGSLACIVTLFMTKRIYQARLDALKAKEYIDTHWLDDFDLDRIATAAGLSRHHLARLFKRFIGMTPYSYYQAIKIEKIKEGLRDTRRSISEVFASCGADYSGRFAEAFKRELGMTPSQYRKTLPISVRTGERDNPALGKPCGQPEHFPGSFLTRSCETEQTLFQIFQRFPIPVQIFQPNGDIAFINEAVLKMWNVLDTTQILKEYNLLKDPFVNEQCGLKAHIRRTFKGEIVLIPDIKIPLESFWEWYKTRSAVYDIEAIYTDILNFPVFSPDGKIVYIISVFFTSRMYQGRPDIARAREYLENCWREEFDINKLAATVRLSPSHLARLFKKHTGMTPYSYYQEIKIDRLKAALRDKNLSVVEAFASCGFEYSGNFTRYFKERVGMTPSQYRKTIGE